MAQYTVIVGKSLLGAFQGPDRPPSHAASIAYFCCHCGEVWASIFTPNTLFYPTYSDCPRHVRGGKLLGAIAVQDLLPFIPLPVWQREVELLFREEDWEFLMGDDPADHPPL